MGTAKDYFNTRAVTFLATLTGYRMIEFAVQICPAMVGCVNVGFTIIIDERVNIRVMSNFEICVHAMFMPD